MNNEEKQKLLKEINDIVEKDRAKIEACYAMAELVKNQYDAFITKGFDKQQATYLSSNFINAMIDRLMNRD